MRRAWREGEAKSKDPRGQGTRGAWRESKRDLSKTERQGVGGGNDAGGPSTWAKPDPRPCEANELELRGSTRLRLRSSDKFAVETARWGSPDGVTAKKTNKTKAVCRVGQRPCELKKRAAGNASKTKHWTPRQELRRRPAKQKAQLKKRPEKIRNATRLEKKRIWSPD